MLSLWASIASLLSKLVGPLLLWFGGRASARADAAEDAVKEAKSANEIDERVGDMSDDELNFRMRNNDFD